MPRKWLVLDANYLCHRAHHALGPLTTKRKELRTEVVFGVLRDLVNFQSIHNTRNVVFCFDAGYEQRTAIYPSYKQNRQARDEMVARQIKLLRKTYLPDLGYKNVLCENGFEADDLIASICHNLPGGDEAIVIAGDHDLFQVISERVTFWNPRTREPHNPKSFKHKYGIQPAKWALVKAIAGCLSDGVPGIEGVGELTALRYVRGELLESSVAYKKIEREWYTIVKRNLKLVKLPMKGTPIFKLRDDRFRRESWNKLIERLEMHTLREPEHEDE